MILKTHSVSVLFKFKINIGIFTIPDQIFSDVKHSCRSMYVSVIRNNLYPFCNWKRVGFDFQKSKIFKVKDFNQVSHFFVELSTSPYDMLLVLLFPEFSYCGFYFFIMRLQSAWTNLNALKLFRWKFSSIMLSSNYSSKLLILVLL